MYSHLPKHKVLLKVWCFLEYSWIGLRTWLPCGSLLVKVNHWNTPCGKQARHSWKCHTPFLFLCLKISDFTLQPQLCFSLSHLLSHPWSKEEPSPVLLPKGPSGEPCPADQHPWAWKREAACLLEIKLAAANSLPWGKSAADPWTGLS